jgi:ferritin-like metal-binding protein YciE
MSKSSRPPSTEICHGGAKAAWFCRRMGAVRNTMTTIEQLTMWLNNAHAMELALVRVLQNHARDARELPEMRDRIEQHLEETHRHADLVGDCLERIGAKPSTLKSVAGNVLGMMQGASTGMFHDELLRNVVADFAAENLEIACYTSLMEAAEAAGLPEIADICSEILQEEEAMAAWLEEQIPEVTRLVMQQTATA